MNNYEPAWLSKVCEGMDTDDALRLKARCRELGVLGTHVATDEEIRFLNANPWRLIKDGSEEEFVAIKDSGQRQEFASGMVRDVATNKRQYHRVIEGPMFERWATHLTAGAKKYPDNADGAANWTKASGAEESRRFKESALRHFMQWYRGDRDEDHASAVFFNINGYEYMHTNASSKTTQEVKRA